METDHEFTLVLDGIPRLTPEIMDALCEAGCDDATVSMHAGQVSMDFGRPALTTKDAVISAIRDVQKANVGARVIRVEASEFDATEDIDGEVLRLIGA